MKAEPKLVVQAGAQLDDWGTPVEVITFVRQVYNNRQVRVDLASNAQANKTIKAYHYYSADKPCPKSVALAPGSLVWCNPPGPVEKVRWFWDVWRESVMATGCGAFLIFNLDHLRTLTPAQKYNRFVFVPWPKRLRFVGAQHQYNHPSGLVFAGGDDVVKTIKQLDGRMQPMVMK